MNSESSVTSEQLRKVRIGMKCVFCGIYSSECERRFHSFPKDLEMSDRWASLSGKSYIIAASPDVRSKRYRVCSAHFLPKDYTSPNQIRLQVDAVPQPSIGCSTAISIDSLKERLQSSLQHDSFTTPNTLSVQEFHASSSNINDNDNSLAIIEESPESQAIVKELSKHKHSEPNLSLLEERKNLLKQKICNWIDTLSTPEEFEAFEKLIAPIPSKLAAMQSNKQNLEPMESLKNEPHNKNMDPQKRLYSIKKVKKNANKIQKPTSQESNAVRFYLLHRT